MGKRIELGRIGSDSAEGMVSGEYLPEVLKAFGLSMDDDLRLDIYFDVLYGNQVYISGIVAHEGKCHMDVTKEFDLDQLAAEILKEKEQDFLAEYQSNLKHKEYL